MLGVAGLLLASGSADAQNLANPVYQGFQPELVEGIDDGLATGRPKVRHVYAATPDTLAVVVDAQAIPIEAMVEYEPEPGDQVRGSHMMKLGREGVEYPRYRTLVRNGEALGSLLDDPPTHLWRTHELAGEALDTGWADDEASYALHVGDRVLTPEQVFRKSVPLMREYVREHGLRSSARHELYLRFAEPLVPGARYRLEFSGGALEREALAFTFDDARLRTEAIHVNLSGHHPDEPQKAALLSMWLGSGGGADFANLESFHVVEDSTGRVAYEGRIELVRAGVAGKQMPEEMQREETDDLPMSVYAMDFSSLQTPGVYRVTVPGLGSSFPFRIDPGVHADATRLLATGFLNQRSGIALGPPHTSYTRPRDMHPDDGFPVRLTDPQVFYDPVRFPKTRSEGNPFARIQASILMDSRHTDAWGGWHDAADADRSILPQNHLRAVHAMLELFESNPGYFAALDLNLPESANGVPDLLDEAAWCVDLFLRIQQSDGGVPSAVESVEHPSEPSHLTSLPTAITPPTPQTCHLYAGAAAHLATLLRPYDAPRAEALIDSALRAMAWADDNPSVPNIYERNFLPAKAHENHAAAHLYRATGDDKWHDRFTRTLAEVHPDGEVRLDRFPHGGPWGEAVYALMPAQRTDADLQARCVRAVIDRADQLAASMRPRPFHLDPNPETWEFRLGEPWPLIVAHRLTGESRYAEALLDLAAFAAGRNPHNASYTRGLGARGVLTFNLDANFLGVPLPEGITVYGPFPRNQWAGKRTEAQLQDTLYPEWKHWPSPASMFDIRYFSLTEFTVGGSMATQLLLRGYLAQHHAGSEPAPAR